MPATFTTYGWRWKERSRRRFRRQGAPVARFLCGGALRSPVPRPCARCGALATTLMWFAARPPPPAVVRTTSHHVRVGCINTIESSRRRHHAERPHRPVQSGRHSPQEGFPRCGTVGETSRGAELTLSFVPEPEQRLWRTVMRREYQLTCNRVQLQNRLEALLEEMHIKLSSVVSDCSARVRGGCCTPSQRAPRIQRWWQPSPISGCGRHRRHCEPYRLCRRGFVRGRILLGFTLGEPRMNRPPVDHFPSGVMV